VLGKPHAVTEYNHPAPNTHASEGLLLLAAYGALQDWDALYVYSYAHSRPEGWDTRRIQGFFDIDQHPTKMATLPAAAALFVRGDVAPARGQVVARLPRDLEIDRLRQARAWALVDAGTVGVAREVTLRHRVALATEGMSPPANALAPAQAPADGSRLVSDTGELVWDLSRPNRGLVTVNTPHSKAAIGYGGGQRVDLGEVSLEPGTGLQEGWSAITLTALDTAPERRPVRWLVTATGYAENTGMLWKNAEKTSVGRDWGRAPSRVEGVPVMITWAAPAAQLAAWALDERGQRRQSIPLEEAGQTRTRVRLGPQWQTVWYEIVVK
jgi:hypothetical protein